MTAPVTGPVSARVEAPELPPLDHPDVALWRPATLADAEAITRAQKTMDAVDHPDWTTPLEDVRDELESSHLDLACDSVLGLGSDGDVLAWGLVDLSPGRATRVQVYLTGGVVPAARGRGVGRRLLAFQEARARQVLATRSEALPARIQIDVDERSPAALALAQRLGMTVHRWFTSMERDLAHEIVAVPAPREAAVITYTPDRADDARLARNDSFRDHWGSQPTQPERWAQFVGGDLFRADLSRIAVDADGRVLGFALCNANPEDWEVQGFTSAYVGVLGVVREARGRGIAPALLEGVLRATAEAGLERVVLDVDTESPTGALGLYERSGFVATSRSMTVARDL
ncbi:GCN5-related N-acetyltransferase [Serinibacter arcticus]|uniref:GCN5-related N-acetyltransferase n=1 Tax=Serinibacter arcticus TaxID=1655435 RepID=A0A4Z1E277_9MICO|nr:GCN5-related N-acetyltransferase [Serinibacter arcticus]